MVVLKIREKSAGNHFDVPVIVPILGTLVCLAMLSQAKAPEAITATAILAGIVGLYFVVRPSREAIEKIE